VAWFAEHGVKIRAVMSDNGSAERTAALPLLLERYNFRRPHGSLGKKAPAKRLNNLVGNYS
jgi:transposase InsO family protein